MFNLEDEHLTGRLSGRSRENSRSNSDGDDVEENLLGYVENGDHRKEYISTQMLEQILLSNDTESDNRHHDIGDSDEDKENNKP